MVVRGPLLAVHLFEHIYAKTLWMAVVEKTLLFYIFVKMGILFFLQTNFFSPRSPAHMAGNGKPTMNEEVYFLLNMVIFQPVMLVSSGV